MQNTNVIFNTQKEKSVSLRSSSFQERRAKLQLLLKNFLEMEEEVLSALSSDLGKSKTEALVQSSLKMGEAIYKQNPQNAQQPNPSGEEPSSDKKDEKVVDAEFEEVDENKKD